MVHTTRSQEYKRQRRLQHRNLKHNSATMAVPPASAGPWSQTSMSIGGGGCELELSSSLGVKLKEQVGSEYRVLLQLNFDTCKLQGVSMHL
ncbi:hypothetical protein GOBAR_AA03110 [Gossypium barbadense]|uniref:Uncharacterized protein n=1 Tax=Gossypium barbadense TaxID=3634 RepID=A0A2P5YPF8_GOSBA|nr:hypothetical protein GOBAR_AA03110 [Gossypium barbadense]